MLNRIPIILILSGNVYEPPSIYTIFIWFRDVWICQLVEKYTDREEIANKLLIEAIGLNIWAATNQHKHQNRLHILAQKRYYLWDKNINWVLSKFIFWLCLIYYMFHKTVYLFCLNITFKISKWLTVHCVKLKAERVCIFYIVLHLRVS